MDNFPYFLSEHVQRQLNKHLTGAISLEKILGSSTLCVVLGRTLSMCRGSRLFLSCTTILDLLASFSLLLVFGGSPQ